MTNVINNGYAGSQMMYQNVVKKMCVTFLIMVFIIHVRAS